MGGRFPSAVVAAAIGKAFNERRLAGNTPMLTGCLVGAYSSGCGPFCVHSVQASQMEQGASRRRPTPVRAFAVPDPSPDVHRVVTFLLDYLIFISSVSSASSPTPSSTDSPESLHSESEPFLLVHVHNNVPAVILAKCVR